jgi:hypothetical protein
MTKPAYADAEIETEISRGTWPVANAHIAYRQMRALEAIAEGLAALLECETRKLTAQPFSVHAAPQLQSSLTPNED